MCQGSLLENRIQEEGDGHKAKAKKKAGRLSQLQQRLALRVACECYYTTATDMLMRMCPSDDENIKLSLSRVSGGEDVARQRLTADYERCQVKVSLAYIIYGRRRFTD